jgi:hypothetical protein
MPASADPAALTVPAMIVPGDISALIPVPGEEAVMATSVPGAVGVPVAVALYHCVATSSLLPHPGANMTL